MLSERDRRLLAGIEQHLAAGSPALDRRMRRASAVRRVWAFPVLTAALGMLLAAGLVALQLVGDAVIVLLLLSWPLARRVWRRRSVAAVWQRWRHRRTHGRGAGGRGTATTGV